MLLTDVVPRSLRVYGFLFGTGVVVIALLAFLHGLGLCLGPRMGATDQTIAAFDLDGEGSICAWFSMTLLLLCGQVSILVWQLCRTASVQPCNESSPNTVTGSEGEGTGAPSLTRRVAMNSPIQTPYSAARYSAASGWEPRLWLVSAVTWFVMSADEQGSLHEGFKELLSHMLGMRLRGDGSVYWAIPYAIVLGVIGPALAWSMRRCGVAVATLALGGSAWGVAVACQLEYVLPGGTPVEVIVEECCEMLGDLSVLVAVMLYARFIVLEIEQAQSTGDALVACAPPQLRVVGAGDSPIVPEQRAPSRRLAKLRRRH